MYRNKTISIVIPCYNEAEAIFSVIGDIPSYMDEIIVVDNGSTDATAEIARKCGAKVFLEHRKGYGYAFKNGLKEVHGDIVAMIDGDGTYAFSEVKKMLDCLIENDLDFVFGNRLTQSGRLGMKKINFIGNIILSFFMRLFFSCSIIDSQSGAWVSNNRLLKEMHLVSNGMSLSEEIKIEAVKSPAIKFREIPIQYKNRIGDSKLNIWRDGISNLLFLFIKRFRPKRGVHGR